MRAREELQRLNIEVRRLRTAIRDETIEVTHALTRLSATSPPLATELQKWWTLRSQVNALNLVYLDRLADLPGFTGTRDEGVRLGSAGFEQASMHAAPCVPSSGGTEIVEGDIDDLQYQFEKLTDFVISIN